MGTCSPSDFLTRTISKVPNGYLPSRVYSSAWVPNKECLVPVVIIKWLVMFYPAFKFDSSNSCFFSDSLWIICLGTNRRDASAVALLFERGGAKRCDFF